MSAPEKVRSERQSRLALSSGVRLLAVLAFVVLHRTEEEALAATLLLRGFSFWLPMLPGFALARRELAGSRPATSA